MIELAKKKTSRRRTARKKTTRKKTTRKKSSRKKTSSKKSTRKYGSSVKPYAQTVKRKRMKKGKRRVRVPGKSGYVYVTIKTRG